MECFINSQTTIYDKISGFNVDILKSKLGAAAYPENDWKTENADQVIDDCLANLPKNRVVDCSPNIRSFSNCYWNKMFQLCPAEIKNESECLY